MPSRRTLLATALLLAPHTLTAGVTVHPDAAHTGDYGLRADIQPACPGEETYLVLGPIITHQQVEACKEIVTAATVEPDGELVALAGDRISFLDGFSVAPGGRLVAGTTGEWDPSYVIDESAKGEDEVVVEWFGSFDQVTLDPGGRFTFLEIRTNADLEARTVYEAADFGGWVWAEVVAEHGETSAGERVSVGPGWHRFGLQWRSGTAESPDGSAQLRFDGRAAEAVPAEGASAATVREIRVGSFYSAGWGGWLTLDNYQASTRP